MSMSNTERQRTMYHLSVQHLGATIYLHIYKRCVLSSLSDLNFMICTLQSHSRETVETIRHRNSKKHGD